MAIRMKSTRHGVVFSLTTLRHFALREICFFSTNKAIHLMVSYTIGRVRWSNVAVNINNVSYSS